MAPNLRLGCDAGGSVRRRYSLFKAEAEEDPICTGISQGYLHWGHRRPASLAA